MNSLKGHPYDRHGPPPGLHPVIVQLRAARLEQDLTQLDLAATLGQESNGVLSRLENGLHEPLLSTLTAWAAALGFDVVLVPSGPPGNAPGGLLVQCSDSSLSSTEGST